jgi:hypothetical protein
MDTKDPNSFGILKYLLNGTDFTLSVLIKIVPNPQNGDGLILKSPNWRDFKKGSNSIPTLHGKKSPILISSFVQMLMSFNSSFGSKLKACSFEKFVSSLLLISKGDTY